MTKSSIHAGRERRAGSARRFARCEPNRPHELCVAIGGEWNPLYTGRFARTVCADRRVARRVALIIPTLLLIAGCAAPAALNDVIVMGMIHDGHRTSTKYGIDVLKRAIERIDPDYVLCEIPPDRLDAAVQEFRTSGKVVEPRVSRFPEYVDALLPLSSEMDFEIVPCAAWTKPMSDARAAKLALFETSRADEYAEMSEAEAWANQKLSDEGMNDDPVLIHTDRYDEIVARGLEPYNRLFNDALGAGGWDNINAGHYALIERALDAHRGEGKRFLIMFGAWHKYWIRAQLRGRDDIRLVPTAPFFE